MYQILADYSVFVIRVQSDKGAYIHVCTYKQDNNNGEIIVIIQRV